MIAPPPGVHVWLACGQTDMRKGFDGLSALVQQQLGNGPVQRPDGPAAAEMGHRVRPLSTLRSRVDSGVASAGI